MLIIVLYIPKTKKKGTIDMRTTFITPEESAKKFMEIIQNTDTCGTKRPERFKKIMHENRGSVQFLSPFAPTEDGLERKNPVIVALGDSVTAGHFEFTQDPVSFFAKADAGTLEENDIVEITDARECYLEKFRTKLIDHYEQTSVSTINSGIAGDTMYGMEKRLERDVIRYQPDLVIINGALNWGQDCGATENYRKVLSSVLDRILEQTDADIILLTPNMEQPGPFTNPLSTLDERVNVIRELAVQKDVCLADTYAAWKVYEAAGYPVTDLLANGMNHPSVTGHEAYAEVLMKLIR